MKLEIDITITAVELVFTNFRFFPWLRFERAPLVVSFLYFLTFIVTPTYLCEKIIYIQAKNLY